MAYQPRFMLQSDEYLADKAQVSSLAAWEAFAAKWFDRRDWPLKADDQLMAEMAAKCGPVKLGGRLWGYTYFTYDLTPEARHEFCSTLSELGDPLRFPEAPGRLKAPEEGWDQECALCEIATYEPGGDRCPQCGRPLISVRSAD